VIDENRIVVGRPKTNKSDILEEKILKNVVNDGRELKEWYKCLESF
jgi:hypothetical protein